MELVELFAKLAEALLEKKGCFGVLGAALLVVAAVFGVLELLALLESC
jgi:hypothetical protein